jgi:hypothetical protein
VVHRSIAVAYIAVTRIVPVSCCLPQQFSSFELFPARKKLFLTKKTYSREKLRNKTFLAPTFKENSSEKEARKNPI